MEFRKTPRGANVPMVECLCRCGTVKVVSLWDVRSGKTRTCGSHHFTYKDRSLPAFNNLYNHTYKKRAIRSGLEFKLKKAEFKQLTQQPCHYCGGEPTGRAARVISGKYESLYYYNGLDRMDNNRGYTIDNVVPCCMTCNRAKNTMSYDDFIKWLDRVINFRSKSFSWAWRLISRLTL